MKRFWLFKYLSKLYLDKLLYLNCFSMNVIGCSILYSLSWISTIIHRSDSYILENRLVQVLFDGFFLCFGFNDRDDSGRPVFDGITNFEYMPPGTLAIWKVHHITFSRVQCRSATRFSWNSNRA